MNGRFFVTNSLLLYRRCVSRTGLSFICVSDRVSSSATDGEIVSKRRFIDKLNTGASLSGKNQAGLVVYDDDFDSFNYGNSSHRGRREVRPTEKTKKMDPLEIIAHLDKYVIGQQEAKRVLAIGFCDHSKRIQNNLTSYLSDNSSFLSNSNRDFSRWSNSSSIACLADEKIHLDKSNILLLGPSGVGKTYISEIVAELLDVPFISANATTLTRAGYVGDDVESIIQKLLEKAGGDVKRAERGVVFIDEIDKIASANSNRSQDNQRDVAGRDVQQSMLKMVEGTKVEVKNGKKNANGQNTMVQVNTKEILFIASGAFTTLDKIVGRRLDKRSLGFGASSLCLSIADDDKEQELIHMKRDKLLREATHEDLVQYGMIQEFAGRFPVIAPFHTLTKDMLKEILSKPKNNLVAQQKKLFELDNSTLSFEDEALEEISCLALQTGTGARALQSIMEKVLRFFKLHIRQTGTVHISRDVVQKKFSSTSCSSK